MKIAFVDLLFSWPPNGGADVDLYNTLSALQRAGHEVHLFATHVVGSWERGSFDPNTLPFPAERLDFVPGVFTAGALNRRIGDALQGWSPEAVFLCDGFFLKHTLDKTLARYPLAVRYYAYEMACHRSILRYRNGAPCPLAYMETPEECRRCALQYLGPEIRAGRHGAWIESYLAANAAAPGYHETATALLRNTDAFLVYNPIMAGLLSGFGEAFVVPGGVDIDAFPAVQPPVERPTKTILMTGRGEDPMKGARVLMEAGERLAATREDFRIKITMPEDTQGPECFDALGWCTHEETRQHYAEADIVVAPSIWDEPFGMVAVEAMATGRPVCASRVGGLQHTVLHEETGLLFERGNAAELATALARLLDDSALRERMGHAGRARVTSEFTWDHIIATHYPPILAKLQAARENKAAAL